MEEKIKIPNTIKNDMLKNLKNMEYIEENNSDKTFGLVFDGGSLKVDNLKRAVNLAMVTLE